ncbi:MAG: transketolase family protein, partial [Leptospiraceae bacterium]|nr:transketolase family protein [Leptospiraceae bacterium]
RTDYKFEIGKAEVRKEGKDVTIVACGVMVNEAEKAVEILGAKGISVTLLNMATIKPIDKEKILHYAKTTGAIVTCEEHNVIGGLGSAVSEFLSEEYPVPVLKVGMKDEFGKSGKWDELLDYFHMRGQDIADACERAILLKK